jgi:hypothetical protein
VIRSCGAGESICFAKHADAFVISSSRLRRLGENMVSFREGVIKGKAVGATMAIT